MSLLLKCIATGSAPTLSLDVNCCGDIRPRGSSCRHRGCGELISLLSSHSHITITLKSCTQGANCTALTAAVCTCCGLELQRCLNLYFTLNFLCQFLLDTGEKGLLRYPFDTVMVTVAELGDCPVSEEAKLLPVLALREHEWITDNHAGWPVVGPQLLPL